MSLDCVVDASVGIKLFLVEPLADRADVLFASLAATPPARLYVPDLFFVECTNILWKYVRRFGYSPEAAQQDVADLVRLPLQVCLDGRSGGGRPGAGPGVRRDGLRRGLRGAGSGAVAAAGHSRRGPGAAVGWYGPGRALAGRVAGVTSLFTAKAQPSWSRLRLCGEMKDPSAVVRSNCSRMRHPLSTCSPSFCATATPAEPAQSPEKPGSTLCP